MRDFKSVMSLQGIISLPDATSYDKLTFFSFTTYVVGA